MPARKDVVSKMKRAQAGVNLEASVLVVCGARGVNVIQGGQDHFVLLPLFPFVLGSPRT